MSQEKILVTASDNIPHSEIEKQLGIVDSQIVVGANIFRDVFASFRDLFGGETKGYKKDLDKMKKAAISDIKEQAKQKGANAIVSLRIDLDEVSGGGKSMFMMNTYGSAVRLKASAFEENSSFDSINDISWDDIKYYKERNNLKEEASNTEMFEYPKILNSITEYDLWNYENTKKFFDSFTSNKISYQVREDFSEFVDQIPVKILEKYLAQNFKEIELKVWDAIYNSLADRSWFDYDFLEENLKHESHIRRFRALQMCILKKEFYDKNDIKKHRDLAHFIKHDFNATIPTKMVKKMMSEKEMYICPNCLNENNLSSNYCDSCNANKFGLQPKSLTPEKISENLIDIANAIEDAVNEIEA